MFPLMDPDILICSLVKMIVQRVGIIVAILWIIYDNCRTRFAALHTDGPRYIAGGALARDAGLYLTKIERMTIFKKVLPNRVYSTAFHPQHEDDNKTDNACRMAEDGEAECSICLSAYEHGDTLITLPHCKHEFHSECILEWLTSNDGCPQCRENVLTPIELREGTSHSFTESQLNNIFLRRFPPCHDNSVVRYSGTVRASYTDLQPSG